MINVEMREDRGRCKLGHGFIYTYIPTRKMKDRCTMGKLKFNGTLAPLTFIMTMQLSSLLLKTPTLLQENQSN